VISDFVNELSDAAFTLGVTSNKQEMVDWAD
jgi:cob(I)alamin adenosyltransferase